MRLRPFCAAVEERSLAGSMTQFFSCIPPTAMILASIYVLGLIVPWFLPDTKGKPLPA